MHFILLLGVFGGFLGIGIYIFHGYRTRKVFFENLLSLCNHLLIEISFSKNTIALIIDKYSPSYSKKFREILTGYANLIRTKSDITHESIEQIMWDRLKPHERATLVGFFYELGRHGAFEEEEKLRNSIEIFKGFLENANTLYKREASIYLKLFIIMGVASVILML